MKALAAITAALLLGLAGLGWLLIPRGSEVALMALRDDRYGDAAVSYAERWAAGERDATLIVPLIEAELGAGRVGAAIDVARGFVERHPEHVAATRLLADLAWQGQEVELHDAARLALARLTDAEGDWRAVSLRGDDTADIDLWLHGLMALQRLDALTPDEGRRLVRLTARHRDPAAALAIARELLDDPAHEAEADDYSFAIRLTLDLGDTGPALELARAWQDRLDDPDALTKAAWQLTEHGRGDLAGELIATNPDLVRRPDGGLGLLLATGQDDRAFAAFLADPQAPRVGPLLADIGWRALAAARDDVLDALFTHQRPALSRNAPLLGAEHALARGGSDARSRAKAWLAEAMATAHEPATELHLLDLLMRVGDTGTARTRLSDANAATMLAPGSLPDGGPVQLAGLVTRLGEAARLLPVFEAARRDSPTADAWAMVAAAAGRTAAVSAWLASDEAMPAPAALIDIAEAARQSGDAGLRRLALERLAASGAGLDAPLALADLHLAAGEPARALALLDALPDLPATAEPLLIQALAASGATERLVSRVTPRLSDARLPWAERAALLSLLLGAGAVEPALPWFDEALRRGGTDMAYAYADAARQAGAGATVATRLRAPLLEAARQGATERAEALLAAAGQAGGPAAQLALLDELAASGEVRWIQAREAALVATGASDSVLAEARRTAALDPRTPSDERRRLAFALLEQGDTAAARAVFQDLARAAAPTSADVRQLLFLWGPRAPGAGLDWLAARAAAAASDGERLAWLRHLQAAGDTSRATALIEVGGGPANADELSLLVGALGERPAQASARDLVAREMPHWRDAAALAALAELAERVDALDLALEAWTRAAAAAPGDARLHRRLGYAALGLTRGAEARVAFQRAASLGLRDPDMLYSLALLTRDAGEDAAAEALLGEALARADSLPDRRQAEALSANILVQLGRRAEGLALFARLAASHPEDARLRADYASALMQNGDYQAARSLLEARGG